MRDAISRLQRVDELNFSFDRSIGSRMYVSLARICVAAVSIFAAGEARGDRCEELLGQVQHFAERLDSVRPTLLRSTTTVDGEFSSRTVYRRAGGVSRRETIRDESKAESYVVSTDQFEFRSIDGWPVAWSGDKPLTEDDPQFGRILGRSMPVDPLDERVDRIWPGGFSLVQSPSTVEFIFGDDPNVVGGCDGDRLVLHIPQPDFGEGAYWELVFDAELLLATDGTGPADWRWPLIAATGPLGDKFGFEDIRVTAAGELPFVRTIDGDSGYGRHEITEVSFEPLQTPVEPVSFLPGMAVHDGLDGGETLAIWGTDGQPMRRIRHEEYRRIRDGIEDAPSDALEGRNPDGGWWFWATNGLLAAVVAGLLFLRRRAA